MSEFYRDKEDVPKFVEFEVAAPGSVTVKRSCGRMEGAADVSISQQGQHWKSQGERRGSEDAGFPVRSG